MNTSKNLTRVMTSNQPSRRFLSLYNQAQVHQQNKKFFDRKLRENRHQWLSRCVSTSSDLPKQRQYDAVIVGGGHNGLVAAAYLAKSGLK